MTGIVSGKVATKEHREFVTCMEMIDLAPPGLYEAVIMEVDGNTENPALTHLMSVWHKPCLPGFGSNPLLDN